MTEREFQRFAALLRKPDPPEMPRRGHRWTQIGDYQRRTTVGLPLLCRWYQRRILLREEGETR